MQVSYDGLWQLLIARDINKTELITLINMGSATLAKLSKNEIVSLGVLMRICEKFNCELGDICCFVKEK